jgi:oxygen-independent coproporphyrinogen-3 oxidase
MSAEIASSTGYGIYVHVPWCRARCPYCAFNVAVDHDPPIQAWVDGIRAAWANVADDFSGPADSLYFGGGTPSLLESDVIRDVIAGLPLTPDAEITLEANPGTVTPENLRAFAAAGVNRISIGVQSFQPSVARRLGRGHTVTQASELMSDVADLGFRSWSVDLIFAVPEQTLDDLAADLRRIRAHRPPHISLYGLTIERDTPFWHAQSAGRMTIPDPDTWRTMYDRIVDELHHNGWHRYEVSNFALPTHESRHNEGVWRGGHYAGLGPGAHGFHPCGDRTTCHRDILAWLADPLPVRARPAPQEAAADQVLTTLRHRDGLSLQTLAARTGHTVDSDIYRPMVGHGLLVETHGQLQLSDDGYPLADGIIRRLCDNLRQASP